MTKCFQGRVVGNRIEKVTSMMTRLDEEVTLSTVGFKIKIGETAKRYQTIDVVGAFPLGSVVRFEVSFEAEEITCPKLD